MSKTVSANKMAPSRAANNMSPRYIYDEISKYVVGQEQAKRVLSVAVYNHYDKINNRTTHKANILMAGPTGCGKTYLVEVISRLLRVPLCIVDATQFTETGYVGRNVNDILGDLKHTAGNEKDAERGIIFIDEIDKLAGSQDGCNRDISGLGVQQDLLKVIEGGDSGACGYDARNVLFIAGGAFSNLVNSPNATRSIGFNDQVCSSELGKQPTTGDFIKYGILPELLGRFHTRVIMDRLDVQSMTRILEEPDNSLIREYEGMFYRQGIMLRFDNDAVRAIAQKAFNEGTGARALRTVLESVLNPLMFACFGSNGKRDITISPEMVITGGR